MAKQRGRPRKVPVQNVVQKLNSGLGSSKSEASIMGTPDNAPIPTPLTSGTASRGPVGACSEKPTVLSQTASRKLEMNHVSTSSEFVANRLPSKGSQLSYVAPVLKDGKPTACLSSDDISAATSKWENAIIMYVIDDCPSLKYINTFISKHWNCAVQPDVFYHNEGYYVVRFASSEEKNSVLYSGPYTIANRPVIVKSWSADFDFHNEILKVVPLWIQLPNLPLTCWGLESLSRIGSTLGIPLFADECTSNQSRISYARLLVEIDVTRPLLHKIMVENPDGKCFEQQIVYDWEPPFCKKCQQVGHVCDPKLPAHYVGKPKKDWIPKENVRSKDNKQQDKQPEKEICDTDWSVPRKTASKQPMIGKNSNSVTTSNTYVYLAHEDTTLEPIGECDTFTLRGGDPIPFGTV